MSAPVQNFYNIDKIVKINVHSEKLLAVEKVESSIFGFFKTWVWKPLDKTPIMDYDPSTLRERGTELYHQPFVVIHFEDRPHDIIWFESQKLLDQWYNIVIQPWIDSKKITRL